MTDPTASTSPPASVSDILVTILGSIYERVDLLFPLLLVHVVTNFLAIRTGFLVTIDRHGAIRFQLVVNDRISHGKTSLSKKKIGYRVIQSFQRNNTPERFKHALQ